MSFAGQLDHDEILQYLNTRYVGPHQAMFALMEYSLHEISHAIIRLAVHLPLEQSVLFEEGQEEDALERNEHTTLTAWFALNDSDPEARVHLYHDIPKHYVFTKRTGNPTIFPRFIAQRHHFFTPTLQSCEHSLHKTSLACFNIFCP